MVVLLSWGRKISRPLTKRAGTCIIGGEEGTSRQAVSPLGFRLCVMRKHHRNRHRSGWRFLLFTMIVTVNGPICNVIRTASPPFRERSQPPASCAALKDTSACRKSFFDRLGKFSELRRSSENLLIENERHPSRVSFVTIFLPVESVFRVRRQSEATLPPPAAYKAPIKQLNCFIGD